MHAAPGQRTRGGWLDFNHGLYCVTKQRSTDILHAPAAPRSACRRCALTGVSAQRYSGSCSTTSITCDVPQAVHTIRRYTRSLAWQWEIGSWQRAGTYNAPRSMCCTFYLGLPPLHHAPLACSNEHKPALKGARWEGGKPPSQGAGFAHTVCCMDASDH